MKKITSLTFAVLVWFAVLAQYYLMLENRATGIGEMTVRFFSYFTILTNSFAASYFTFFLSKSKNGFMTLLNQPGTLTAIVMYITIVGLVYQFVLRQQWHPQGLQMVVDELLHTVNPLVVVLYWYWHENKSAVRYRQILNWLLYPVVYLVYILVRGNYSGFYPYPFVDVNNLGLTKVGINCGLLLLLFCGLSAAYIKAGKMISTSSYKKNQF
ncbi:Pr6Pr family membrane protein [Flavobacterium sp. UMI-01]|uniref:Pr6Pr family membrane protein n=1 Tax=Flavobacterium sp. UMI-01 TaxID=1441053 RepID=UPI001C7D4252|nr:Pr6Pr family membrane protein [Flavobacterium sp. UMI-01]GIZ07683.1 hypothetical protein FUMI01_04100 [Flavobacterium sp. UMI-01]